MRASLTAVVVVLLATLSVAGCSQMGQSTSPSAPSSLSPVTPAPGSLSQSGTVAPLETGTPYDASGSWHFQAYVKQSGQLILLGEADITFTQDADGSLHGVVPDEDDEITLTLRRTGPKILYDVSTFTPGTPCNEAYSGSALLDTTSDRLLMHLSGTESDCVRLNIVLRASKN